MIELMHIFWQHEATVQTGNQKMQVWGSTKHLSRKNRETK